MGKQWVPDDIGKEIGVRADLRKGHPKPREIKSQEPQLEKGASHGDNKAVKLPMSEKVIYSLNFKKLLEYAVQK